jgi:uncharacterized delta-60 repeat protein
MLKQCMLGMALLGSALSVTAQGVLDPAFGGGDGWAMVTSNGSGDDLIALDGGKTLVCGDRSQDGVNVAFLARLTADGSIDPTYMSGGIYTVAGTAAPADQYQHTCALAREGGRIYVAILRPLDIHVVPLDGDGMLSSFNPPQVLSIGIPASPHMGFIDIAARNGSIYVAVGTQVGTENGRVFKINSLGQPDMSWGVGGFAYINDGVTIGDLRRIAVTPSNRVLAMTQQNVSNGYDYAIVELLANGTRNTAFGSGGVVRRSLNTFDFPRDIFSYADGRFLIAGSACDGNTGPAGATGCRFGIARYLGNGQPDTSFGAAGARRFSLGFDAFVYAAAIDPQGRIIGVGATIAETPSRAVTTRVRADGATLDTLYGNAGTTRSGFSSSNASLLSVIAESAHLRATGRGYYARGGGEPQPYALIARYTQ